ncbi:fibroblast growth factor 19-like [Rhincodon typus]|uniref:fibroblast growth factor 19-like n=1 Tax=Rhincodon typus TaxID=259920 RepID=UPI00202F0929|nr:fibroblast growth factor 19-like [Rhincodon typus]
MILMSFATLSLKAAQWVQRRESDPADFQEKLPAPAPGLGMGTNILSCVAVYFAVSLGASLVRSTPLVRTDSGAQLERDWGQQIRFKHLYMEGNSRHLQINPDGHIDSSNSQNFYTLLEIKAVEPGHVVIRGVRTGRYLCMDTEGSIFGSMTYREDDCNFKEEQLQTFYNVYHSPRHKMVLSLSLDKRPFIPNRELPPLSMFLPRENELPTTMHSRRNPERETNDTDPFEMRTGQLASPKLSRIGRG